jgi:hypothetical protein
MKRFDDLIVWQKAHALVLKIYAIILFLLILSLFPVSCFLFPSVLGQSPSPEVQFINSAPEAGLNFRHTDGRSGKRYLIEILGSGAAFLDYDDDGDLDVYLANATSLVEPKPKLDAKSLLYRNNGDGSFTEVSKAAGIEHISYGTGCAAGDYDNDGDIDLYLTNFGPNLLYRNNGDGTFTEVASQANAGNAGDVSNSTKWSTGCAFGDYDKDGDLDLFVANYCDYTIQSDKPCYHRGVHSYCNPMVYPGSPSSLYKNNGDGSFSDVSESSGIWSVPPNRGLGAVWGDYDNDGDIDLYVANDKGQNYLYQNKGNETFEEVALLAGVGYGETGEAEASMGVAMSDYDNDGFLDLTVSNFQNEPNTLYHNNGNGLFSDVTYIVGIGEITYRYLGWGMAFFDYDNDRYKDIFVANGHIQDNISDFERTMSYDQINLLLKNRGDGKFENVTFSSGTGLLISKVSRGAAFGDYDNDGDMDILVTNLNDSVDLLRNDDGNRNNWIKIKTVCTIGNRSGIGVRIKVVSEGITQMAEVQSGGSYLCQSDLRLHFGLGKAEKVELIEIRWTDGSVETVKDVRANQMVIAVEGKEVKSNEI